MKYQKRDILFDLVRIVIFTLTAITMIIGFFWWLTVEISVVSCLCALLGLLSAYFLVVAWKGWFTLISQYRYAKESDVLDTLVGVNKYATDEEMRKAFEEQRAHCLYSDDRLILTEEFLADEEENVLFFINGILDAETTEHRSNVVIDKVVLSIIYYDGERYKIVYRRSDVNGSMNECAERLLSVSRFIASHSKNFRRHLPPKNK